MATDPELHAEASAPRGTRLGRAWPYLLLAAALLAVGLSGWQPIPAGVWNDDGVYMLISKAIASGRGLRYAGVPGAPPAVKFPPLYPGLLSGLWLLLGSIGPVTFAAELLNLALLAGAGAVFSWALAHAGVFRRGTAVAVGALAFVSADLWHVALIPLSEALFVFLCACALAAWSHAQAEDRPRAWMPLALVLVVLVLTRSAGAAVVAGFAIALLRRRRLRTAVLVSAPAVLAMLAWGIWSTYETRFIPATLRDLLGPYGAWLARQTIGAPTAFLRALPWQALGVLGNVASFLVPGLVGNVVWIAALPLAAALIVGVVRLGRAFPPIPWIAGVYLAMVSVWPYLDRRLVVPVHPLVVALVAVGGLDFIARAGRRRLRVALLAVALLWVGWYGAVSVERDTTGWMAAPYRLRAKRLAAAVEALDRTVPRSAVVGAPEFWAALHLYGGWPVVPSARFEPRADGATPVWGTPMQQLEIWWEAHVSDVLLEQGGEIHGKALDLLSERCPGSVQVLARMPPQLVVGIRWGPGCAAALGLPGPGS